MCDVILSCQCACCRKSTNETLLATGLPGLVFSDQFIQLPFRISDTAAVYGWGENEQVTQTLLCNIFHYDKYFSGQFPA